MPPTMDDRENDNFVVREGEEDPVREPSNRRAPNSRSGLRVNGWTDLDSLKGRVNVLEVLIAESVSLELIPVELLLKISCGAFREPKPQRHPALPPTSRRIRSRTTSQDCVALGSASYSASRRSNSSASSEVTANACSGESSAMLSQRSSTS